MKKVIQTYKSGSQWIKNPPGWGDFIRGSCHLFEKLKGSGCELKIDLSQTDFSSLIDFDPSFFHVGETLSIAAAEEFFEADEHETLHAIIDRFLSSQQDTLYLCTNLGAWDRTSLAVETRNFAKKLYCFNAKVTQPADAVLMGRAYEALSIRAGDTFIGKQEGNVGGALKKRLFRLIETKVLPYAKDPIVVTSDSYDLKCELAQRYDFMMFPHVSQHGAYGNALPVAMDMNLLKHSKFNYHINAWKPWWSGFSHYTSLVFSIPSANFRSPLFVKEEITSTGELQISTKERLLAKLKRAKKRFG